MYYAGRMGDSTIIAAIGLGNIIQNSVIEPIFSSLNSGLEVLVSPGAQSYASQIPFAMVVFVFWPFCTRCHSGFGL